MNAQYRNSSPPACSIALQLPEDLQAFAADRNLFPGVLVLKHVDVQRKRVTFAIALHPAGPPADLTLRIEESAALAVKLIAAGSFDERHLLHRAKGFFLYRELSSNQARQKFRLLNGRDSQRAIQPKAIHCVADDPAARVEFCKTLLCPQPVRDFHAVPCGIEQDECPGQAVAIEDRVQLDHLMIGSPR